MTLRVRNLIVSLGGRRIVSGASLAAAPSDWLGIVGANGSGKTTLLRALAGRLPIEGGELLLHGRDRTADRAGRALGIGINPDADALPGELSGTDVLDLVAMAAAEKPHHDELGHLRASLDLERFWRDRVGLYSAGMKQRLAIYAAFVAGQGVVILDEPFNWLDPVTAFDLRHVLTRMVEEGLTLITALHDVATFGGCCGCGLVMSEGRIAISLDHADMRRARSHPEEFERRIIDQLRTRSRIAA